jgi:hypothetical protein
VGGPNRTGDAALGVAGAALAPDALGAEVLDGACAASGWARAVPASNETVSVKAAQRTEAAAFLTSSRERKAFRARR